MFCNETQSTTHPDDMKNHPAPAADANTDNDDNDDDTRDNESSKAHYNQLSRLDTCR